MNRKWIIALITLILALNYTPLKWMLEFGREYHYATPDGKARLWELPSKGQDFDNVMQSFAAYKEHPGQTDTVLHRIFVRNPLLVWRWHDYLFHPRYRLPYLDPQRVASDASAMDALQN